MSGQGMSNIPNGAFLDVGRISKLHGELAVILKHWQENNPLGFKPLIDVHYTKIVAKSNRISNIFDYGKISSNDAVRGARFNSPADPKHIITYCLDEDCVKTALEKIENCKNIISQKYNGRVGCNDINELSKGSSRFNSFSKSAFAEIVKDLCWPSDGAKSINVRHIWFKTNATKQTLTIRVDKNRRLLLKSISVVPVFTDL